GATEVKPPMLADAIVEVTETGSSLRANHLRIMDMVLESNTQIIANKAAWMDGEKRRKIENLALMLRGAMEAKDRVGLMLNVRKLESRGLRLGGVEPAVRRIVGDVRRHGDQALRKYAKKFDGLGPSDFLLVPDSELRKAWQKAPGPLKSSMRITEQNIRNFCEWQKPKEWRRSRSGISLGQLVRPLESVGCYVPGGRFPLVSTLLMTV